MHHKPAATTAAIAATTIINHSRRHATTMTTRTLTSRCNRLNIFRSPQPFPFQFGCFLCGTIAFSWLFANFMFPTLVKTFGIGPPLTKKNPFKGAQPTHWVTEDGKETSAPVPGEAAKVRPNHRPTPPHQPISARLGPLAGHSATRPARNDAPTPHQVQVEVPGETSLVVGEAVAEADL